MPGESRARATRHRQTIGLEAALRALGFEIVLHVEGYEFPQCRSGWDANALLCEI
jgi:hypothetical protein